MKDIKEISDNYAMKSNCTLGEHDKISKAFMNGFEFANKWIDVEDELPPENIPVIVKMNYCFAFTDITATDICYLRNNRWINALRNQYGNSNVISWRPIEYK